jgi:hypothetical protein
LEKRRFFHPRFLGLISFSFGYVSGMMPILDGITFGVTYGFLLFLFIFHDYKKNNRHE